MEQPVRRRPRKRKISKTNRLLIAGCVIGAVALIVAACIIFGGGKNEEAVQPANPDRSAMPELTVGDVTRDGERMVVDTSYMDVAYPYAFSDLISVEAVNQDKITGLEFTAKIDGSSRALYTIWFNSTQGQTAGTFDPQDGEGAVVVTVEFFSPEEALQGDHLVTFYATQETINDVLDSMKLDKNFTAKL